MQGLLSISPVYRFAITLVFAGIVVALSITPGIERPGDSIFSWLVVNTATPLQKAMHVATYAILAALWMWSLETIESRFVRAAIALAATVGLGAVLEWCQTMVPGRFGTAADVFLNFIGAVVGLVATLLLV